MKPYHERLIPSPTVFIGTALVVPATITVFVPIDVTAGVVIGIAIYLAVVLSLTAVSPVIAVDGGILSAGRARLPLGVIGSAVSYAGADATEQRGPMLDARAWLVMRGWIGPIVRIDLNDPDDPVPYWLVSTRHPRRLLAALGQDAPALGRDGDGTDDGPPHEGPRTHSSPAA